ncbi:MAG: alpha-glucan family phosphorylase, partial [Nannocystaceae bacterium]
FCGKAHPRDIEGKRLITEVHRLRDELGDAVRLVYVPGYNMTLGGLMTSGVDVWLNTPRAPQEASGTSGMKASHNGIPNLSIVDGWWCEGWIEGKTGWGIEAAAGPEHVADRVEAECLLELLEHHVLPLYHQADAPGRGDGWASLMRSSIALAASYFNAERMLAEYCALAYNLT